MNMNHGLHIILYGVLATIYLFTFIHASSYISLAGPWAGYISTDYGTGYAPYNVSAINGSWIVEAALPTNNQSYGSQWIGIGGYGNTNLLQIGTRSNYAPEASYSSFFETYYNIADISPNNPFPQNIPYFYIRPGDKIYASISLTNKTNCPNNIFSQSCWKLNINDLSRNEHNTSYVAFTPNMTSADWIEESQQCIIPCATTLAKFGIANFGSIYTGIKYANNATSGDTTNSIGTFNGFITNIVSNGAYVTNTSNLNPSDQSSFKIYGSLILNLNLLNPKSQYASINFGQLDLITGSNATGGTGLYSYQWLEEAPSTNTFVNATTACSASANTLMYSFATGAACATPPGRYTFRIKVTDNATLDNYTSGNVFVFVNPPNSILHNNFSNYAEWYVPITIHNTRGTATTIPSQQAIYINSSKYSSFENYNLSNIQFAYLNGTPIPSWLEGPLGNRSASTLYWLSISRSIVAYGSITVYMIFEGQNRTLFNATGNTGVNPYLFSSSFPKYAYDNGNNVFPFYDNFAGNVLSAKWNTLDSSGQPTTQGYIVDNGLSQAQIAGTEVSIYATQTFHYGQTADFGGSIPTIYNENSGGFYPCEFGFGTNAEGFYDAANAFINNVITRGQAILLGSGEIVYGGGAGCPTYSSGYAGTWLYDEELPNNNIYAAPSSSSVLFGENANTTNPYNITSYSGSSDLNYQGQTANVAALNTGEIEILGLQMSQTSGYDGIFANGFLDWVRVRNAPPDGVMPNVTVGLIQSLNASTFNRVVRAGVKDTIYVHSFNPTDLLQLLIRATDPTYIEVNGIGSTNYTICSKPSTCLQPGTYTVTLFDLSAVYNVTWPLLIASSPSISLSPVNAVLDQGQQIYVHSNATNGTGRFTYQWYNVTLGMAYPIANAIGSTYLVNTTDPGLFKYVLNLTDVGAGNPVSVQSNNVDIVVNPALSVNITPANSIVYNGNTVTFNAVITGGTGNFTYQWYNFSSHFFGKLMTNKTSNALILPFNSPGKYSYFLMVTDKGTTTSPLASSMSHPVNVTVLFPPSITLYSTANTIYALQSVEFTNTTSGGVPPYTYTYSVFQYGVIAQNANYIISGNSIQFKQPGLYNVMETVTDSIGEMASSSISIMVKPQILCTAQDNATAISVIGSRVTNTMKISSQNLIYISGSNDNVTVDAKGDCYVTISIKGNSNKLNIFNGSVSASVMGNSNRVYLHNSSAANQSIIRGSSNFVSGLYIKKDIIITGSDDIIEMSISGANSTQEHIRGSSDNLTAEVKNLANFTVAGSSNLLKIHNGTVSISVAGSANHIYICNAIINGERLFGRLNYVYSNSC